MAPPSIMKALLTFFFNPFKLKLKHSLGAYDNKKKVPSPLGTILLILKRKRPHLYGYGKMDFFSVFSTFSLQILFHICIGYKNIPVSIDDAPKAVQGERNVVTTISARSAQRI